MKEILSFIKENLITEKRVILMTVVEAEGSSPGKAGFKMAVTEDGLMKGSIGGGQTEYRLVEMAKKSLLSNVPDNFLKHEIHQADAEIDRSGMICSGEQWVAFYPLSSEHLLNINEFIYVFENGKKGMLHFSNRGIEFHEGEQVHHQHKKAVASTDDWLYLEETGNTNQLYIFGAGHVGLALCKIMKQLDFTVNLFDDRKSLSTREDNDLADFNELVDFKNIQHLVQNGSNSYSVIMTFGHKSDEIVLRQLLEKEVKYLGMMGSKKKVSTILKKLKSEGFDLRLLDKVDAPIGLAIGSQTPSEIAVSIAAKIIQIKNSES